MITKGFVVVILCKLGLPRDLARYLIRVHLRYYWPPASIPSISRGGDYLLFENNRVLVRHYTMRSGILQYSIYWNDQPMCAFCGRKIFRGRYRMYHTGQCARICWPCHTAVGRAVLSSCADPDLAAIYILNED